MRTKQINTKTILYTFAFALALGLRFLNLGKVHLADLEAGWALQAWDVSQGVLSQPAYVALTRAIFFFLGSSNALARFWPALMGSLLVLVPITFQRSLGRKAALILAFGLALDPGLVAISRLAGSPMMAISFTALALTMFYRQVPAWAGVFGALALLSGSSIWIAFSGALVFGLLLKVWGRADLWASESTFQSASTRQETLKTGLMFGAGTLLFVGSLFLSSSTTGLSAWASDAAFYFLGWVMPSGISWSRVVVGLVMYAPLAFVFSVVAGVEHEQSQRPLVRVLLLWALAVLTSVLVYPGRQVADVAWALLPIWVLAALGVARYWGSGWMQPVVWGQAAAQFVVLLLFWLISAGSFHLIAEAEKLRGALFFGLLGFGTLTFIFVGLGWSWLEARRGVALGVGAALLVYGLAAVFGLSQANPTNPAELWLPQTSTGQADLLLETLEELSLRETGQAHNLDGIALIDSPALRWALRDFKDIVFAQSLEAVETTIPTVILALPEDSGKLLATAYRGQDFIWQVSAKSTGALPSEWERWLIFRDAPLEMNAIVLWVREDLFSHETP